MSWVTNLLLKDIEKTDTVLDIGCGFLAPYAHSSITKIVAVDIYAPYLDKMKYQYHTIRYDVSGGLGIFLPDSFDIVSVLDVVEHFEKGIAIKLLVEMERVARKKVIVLTPSTWKPQCVDSLDAWGYPNKAQEHKSLFTVDELSGLGYVCSIVRNGQIYAVKSLRYTACD